MACFQLANVRSAKAPAARKPSGPSLLARPAFGLDAGRAREAAAPPSSQRPFTESEGRLFETVFRQISGGARGGGSREQPAPGGRSMSSPSDAVEIQADQMADRALGTGGSVSDVSKAAPVGGPPRRDLPRPELQLAPTGAARPDPSAASGEAFEARLGEARAGGGEEMPSQTRAFMEPRFGASLGEVRVHRDARANRLAASAGARAFTVGRDLFFGRGEFQPETDGGRRLIAHELAHVVQQGASPGGGGGAILRQAAGGHPAAASPAAAGPGAGPTTAPGAAGAAPAPGAAEEAMSRLETLCAASQPCTEPDAHDGPKGEFKLTIMADKEGPFLAIPFTGGVGHAWLELTDKEGTRWTYGFWPASGFDAEEPTKDVPGCVHHPDTEHRPTATQTFTLTEKEFSAALLEAQSICAAKPAYNLFGLQCTSFVRRVLDAAGKGPAGGFGLIWDSPNALNSWLRANRLLIGFSAARTERGTNFGGDVQLTRQFFSTLSNKLRLDWQARGILGSRIQSLSAGVGIEITSQRVFLPKLELFGGATVGQFGAATPQVGAGVELGAGLSFGLDEIVTVGVEYNVVKDLINKDGDLQRLMFRAQLSF